MKRYGVILAAAMMLASSGAVAAQTVGDWVLGNYKNSGYWFAGVIAELKGDSIRVQYDDGEVELLPQSQVKPYNWMIGTAVECNFQKKGEWYPGKITSLAAEKVGIAYDDGDTERTTTGLCRSR